MEKKPKELKVPFLISFHLCHCVIKNIIQWYEVYKHSLSSPGQGIPGRSGTQGNTEKNNTTNLKYTNYIEF